MSEYRILVQGVGSVGGLIAGRQIDVGCDVTLVTGNEDITRTITKNGIRVLSDDGDVAVQTTARTNVAEISRSARFDAIYLAMMAQHSVASIQQSMPLLKDDGYVVTFQNGIVIDAIGAVCGAEKLLPSTLAFGATMESHGVYRLTTSGSIILGEIDGSLSGRLDAAAAYLQFAMETRKTTNIMGVLWGKLCWNSSVSAICAITGRTLGDICGDPATQKLILLGYREAVETARADDVMLEKVVVDYERLYVPQGATPEKVTQAIDILEPLKERYAAVNPSTSQSLAKGKLTEIDYLNGYVTARAKRQNRSVPLNERLVELVKEIEQGKRAISPTNIEKLIPISDQYY